MKRSLAGVLALTALVSFAADCALNKAEQGAIVGAGAGGVAGAVVGKATGSTVRGAIIGAAVGGAAGAIIGHQMDKQAQELAYDLPGATVQRIGEGIAVTFPEGLLFEFDSDQIGSGAGDNLRKLAASLKTVSQHANADRGPHRRGRQHHVQYGSVEPASPVGREFHHRRGDRWRPHLHGGARRNRADRHERYR